MDARNLPKVIALCGLAGSGKSAAAAYLIENHNYKLVKFAAPLKKMLSALGLTLADIEGEHKETPNPILCGKTPRHAMQTLGTEWGRQLIGPEFWTTVWKHHAQLALAAGHGVIVDDCRFDNELRVVNEMGGVAIKIERPGVRPVNAHVSENGINTELPVVVNDADIPTLVSRVIGAAQ